MRAAFLFSGQLRGFEYCVKSLQENLFSAFDEYDTFFYIPDSDGKTLLEHWCPTSVTIEKDQYHPEVQGFNNRIASSENKIANNGYQTRGRMQHYYLQWYGVKRCFELFDAYRLVNNIHHDVIFRMRCDFYFHEKFTYEHKPEAIQIPSYKGHGGLYDRLAFGSYDFMKHYCSLYDKVMEGNYQEIVALGNSESKLMQHIAAANIPVRFVPMVYERLNKDGSSQSHSEIDPG